MRRHMTRNSVIDCQRCGKSEFLGIAAEQGWNVELKDGAVDYFLCPNCQTEAEHLEAHINESTVLCEVGGDGLVRGFSKAVR